MVELLDSCPAKTLSIYLFYKRGLLSSKYLVRWPQNYTSFDYFHYLFQIKILIIILCFQERCDFLNLRYFDQFVLFQFLRGVSIWLVVHVLNTRYSMIM